MAAQALLESLFLDEGLVIAGLDPDPKPPAHRIEDFLDDLYPESEKDRESLTQARERVALIEGIEAKLSDWHWRMNHLYHIVNEKGEVVVFTMNYAQERLFRRLHDRNLVLKARQLGMTTGVMIFLLDAILFRDNVSCGVIAHGLREVADLFRKKILFAYDLLPDWLRALRPAVKRKAGELVLANGSSITVGVSLRSGTYQYVHISEFGKICRLYPQRAEEVVTGTLQTLHAGSVLFIESTAEGRQGYFHDYCQQGLSKLRTGRKLTRLDNRLHFFPWYEDGRYRLSAEDTERVPIPERLAAYFTQLEDVQGIELDACQRAWYVLKEEELGPKIKQEFPSTPEEAFEKSLEGAYYGNQLGLARQQGRVTSVRYNPSFPVHAVWDIGYNDCTAIWFIQILPTQTNLIRYYEHNGEGLAHYAAKVAEYQRKYGYRYAGFIAGHDIAHHDWSTGKTRADVAKETYAIKFEAAPLLGVNDGIELTRMLLNECYFDEAGCELGLTRLESYSKQWDAKRGCYKDNPLHDVNSNGADAFRYIAQWHPRYGAKRLRAVVSQSLSPAGQSAPVSRVR